MKFLYLVVVIFLCGLIGTAVGEIILFFVPISSNFYNFLSSSFSPLSFSIDNFNLVVCSISLSIITKITPFTLFGIIAGCIYSLTKI